MRLTRSMKIKSYLPIYGLNSFIYSRMLLKSFGR